MRTLVKTYKDKSSHYTVKSVNFTKMAA